MTSANTVRQNFDASLDHDIEYDNIDRSTTSPTNPSPSRSIISQESNIPFDDDDIKGEEIYDRDGSSNETLEQVNGEEKSHPSRDILDQDAIVKITVLKSISSQLRSAYVQKTDSGQATCLAVSNIYIAVGTGHGMVFCFDKQQVMRWCLRKDGHNEAVSSMVIREDSTRLVSGYAKGSFGVWNLENGSLIVLVPGDCYRLASPLILRFTSDPDLMVFSDTGGSVFQVWIRKRSKYFEPNCIFSGSRGEVLHLDTLVIPSTLQHKFSSLNDLCLLALATVTKVIVVSLRPSTSVHFYHPLKAEPRAPPVLSWKFVSIQISPNDRVLDPVLAFGRGQVFNVFQLSVKNEHELSFISLRRFNLTYTILNLEWLTAKIIATLDNNLHLHVIDVRSGKEIGLVDVNPVQLVFSTEFFNGSHIDGHVSKAMACLGEQACYNSITTVSSHSSHLSPNQILILGHKLTVIYSLRPWDKRIDWYTSTGNYQEALAFAVSVYNGEAKAVIGLFGNRAQRQSTVADKVISLIDEYLNTCLPPSPSNQAFYLSSVVVSKDLSQAISSVIEASLIIGRMDVIWEVIYERCKVNKHSNQVFLESLEPHILNQSIHSLPPIIAKDLVNLYDGCKLYKQLESLVIRLNIDCLDIHQVTTIFRHHHLYEGLIYIYNEAFLDFCTPLELLLRRISPKLLRNEPLTKDDIDLGNKILLYISCCLSGRKFHGGGEIPESIRNQVRQETIKFIIRFKNPQDPEKQDDSTLDCTFYPNLKSLLLFDVKDFLNVLALAMDGNDFDCHEGLTLTEVLIHVMTESCGFTSSQIGSLFIFLARMVSKPKSFIKMSDELFNQIVESLIENSDNGASEERQQALMSLVTSDKTNEIMLDRILIAAEKAKFFQICEHIYWQRKEFSKILTCYLSDQHLSRQVFSLIDRILKLNEGKVRFLKSIWENIGKLVEVDQPRTTNLLLEYFIRTNDLENLLNSLESKPRDMLNVLKCCLNCDLLKNLDQVTNSLLVRKCKVLHEPWIHEKYIELLCKYEPDEVAEFLRTTSTYRSNVALQICSKAQNHPAEAVLLEKEEKFTDALELLLRELDQIFEALEKDDVTNLKEDGRDVITIGDLLNKFQKKLENLIQFARRCSEKLLTSEDREYLWLPLLERVIRFHEIIEQRWQCFKEKFLDISNNLFNNMTGYISLLTILRWILDSSITTEANKIGQLSKIRYLLAGMLEAYNYEATLLSTYNNMIKNELHQLLTNYVNLSRKAYPISNNCARCDRKLEADGDEGIAIFSCHSFHYTCLDGNEESGCPVCEDLNSHSQTLKTSMDADMVAASPVKRRDSECYNEFIPIEENQVNFSGQLREWEKLSDHFKNDRIVDPFDQMNKKIWHRSTWTTLNLIPRGFEE